MNYPRVSIIIVNWNGYRQLKQCLPHIYKQDYKNFEVIIVDNNSTDGSIEFLEKKYPKTIIKKCKRNYGFAKGCNKGLTKATGEYILLLNNDTIVTRNFLTILVSAIKKNASVAVVQPKIIFEKTRKLQSGGAFMTSSGFLYHFGYGKNPKDKKYNHEMDIFSANGSCMLIRSDVIKKVGGLFDSDFFAYFEETDFCWRVWLGGYKIRYIPSALIYHEGAQTSQLLSSSFITFHAFKNRICTLIKNLDAKKLTVIVPLHLCICVVFSFYSLIMFRSEISLGILKAIVWNIKHLPSIIEKRKKTQELSGQSAFAIDSLIKDQRISYFYYLFKGLEYYKD